MNKYTSIFITMILSLKGCFGNEKMGFNIRDKMNMQTADRIVECINNLDVDGMYNLFSEEVRFNDKILKKDIERIYHYLNGKVEFYEKWAVSSTTDVEQNKNSTYYYSSFKMMLNGVEYYLYYIYYPKNDFNTTKEGVESLKIVKVEEDEKYFCYWQDMKLGIFLPDEAK